MWALYSNFDLKSVKELFRLIIDFVGFEEGPGSDKPITPSDVGC